MNIFKYKVGKGINRIEVPKGTEFLSLGVQRDELVVWAKVPSEPELEVREVFLVFTGEFYHEYNGKFLGTVQKSNGLVYHAFAWDA